MTSGNLVQLDVDGALATVTLNRPDKHNALTLDMLRDLNAAAQSIRKNRAVRAVILNGAGESFCAGLDFKSTTAQPLGIMRAFISKPGMATNHFQQATWCWRELPVPVIAAIHGHCYGGGLQIALAADFRFATAEAQLSVMEIKWGLIPDMSGTVFLRELLPMDVAKRLTMTGELLSGRQAKALHLVTGVSSNPLTAARKLASELADKSPDALAAAKDLLQRNWQADEPAALATERRIQARLLAGRNQRIALKAAIAGKAPAFRHRSYRK